MTTNGRTKDWNNPCSVQRLERAILIGIQSADFIKASGQSAGQIGRTYGNTRPMASKYQKILACGGHPYMDTTAGLNFREGQVSRKHGPETRPRQIAVTAALREPSRSSREVLELPERAEFPKNAALSRKPNNVRCMRARLAMHRHIQFKKHIQLDSRRNLLTLWEGCSERNADDFNLLSLAKRQGCGARSCPTSHQYGRCSLAGVRDTVFRPRLNE